LTNHARNPTSIPMTGLENIALIYIVGINQQSIINYHYYIPDKETKCNEAIDKKK